MWGDNYSEWNNKKIKAILDFYGHKFFYMKKILDVGAGHGDIGGFFSRLGAEVTSVDARQEHLKLIVKKYPNIKIIKSDLDGEWIFNGKPYDIIFDLGVLCHLLNVENHIRNICKSTCHLVLETTVCDSLDTSKIQQVNENKDAFDLSFNGIGSRPSTALIERLLTENNMNFIRIDNVKLNADKYKYDWQEKNNNECDFYKRRIWFCVKKNSLVNFSQSALNKSSSTNAVKKHTPITLPQKATSGDTFGNIENLKVAICISGHLRTFDKTYNSFLSNVIIPSQEKVARLNTFISTWETIGTHGSKGNSDDHLSNIKTIDKKYEIEKILNPVDLHIDQYYEYEEFLQKFRKDINNHHVDTYVAMFYNMYNLKKMIEKYENENNIKYDLIIRTRSDLLFRSKVNFCDFQKDYVYSPTIGRYFQNGMNDQFAIGNNENMKIYFNIFEKLAEYIKTRRDLPRPEHLIRHHLFSNGVPLKNFQVNYAILRANGFATEQVEFGQTWKKISK
ncbi:MAG: methyltransferase domain-containing protein [Chitinophagales bacterium]|nr:methyltransferase domain-containing protein [Chitinophagales bacterium]